MKQRPIIFSGPMVRAILDGKKTQTRRVVKPKSTYGYGFVPTTSDDKWIWSVDNRYMGDIGKCPYGVIEDQLWVREKYSYLERDPRGLCEGTVWYWADGNVHAGDWTRPRSPIHMPRWASRVTLEILSVRIERVRDITPEDARAEGMDSPREWQLVPMFARGWNQINAKRQGCSWEANPWVWAVEFRRIDQPLQ